MSRHETDRADRLASLSDHELLLLLDLAEEVLEGMDQLGVQTRSEIEDAVVQIERRIAEHE